MAKITYPDKSKGDLFTSEEANEVKTVVNANDNVLNPEPIGTVFEQDFSTDQNLDAFTVVGANTSTSFVDGKLRVTRTGGSVAFDQYLRLNKVIVSRNFTITARIQDTTYDTANQWGILVGTERVDVSATNSKQYRQILNKNASAADGKLNTYINQNLTPEQILGTGLDSKQINDIYTVKLSANETDFCISFKNERTGEQNNYSERNAIIGGSIGVGAFQFAIYTIQNGHTFDVLDINVTYDNPVGVEWTLIGDSRTAGASATLEENRWQNVLFKKLNISQWSTFAQGGMQASRINNELSQITPNIGMNVIFWADVNDIGAGTPVSNIQNDISDIILALENQGANVIIIVTQPYDGEIDSLTMRNWYLSNYKGSNVLIDMWTLFEDTTTPNTLSSVYGADEVHLNDLGHRVLAQIIYDKVKGL